MLAGLLDRRNVPLPRDVHGHVVFGRLDHEAQPAQRLEHLDAEGPDGGVGPVGQRGRRADHVLRTTQADVDEGVDDAEVGVLAEPEDGEPVVVARVHVEVVPVVEVPVAGGRVGDELGGLVDGVVVPGGEAHDQQQAQALPQPPATGAPHAPPTGSAASPVVANTGSSRRAPT